MDAVFEKVLRDHLPRLREQPLTDDTGLRDLGLDSMKSVDLLFAIEDEMDVALPDDDLNEETFATAGSLWRAVDSARTSEAAA
ncbi:phosphopantetheine-binding protein [Streptomyces sp. NPDC102395]|uniref:phosphopantetheine-binding protein n=1 Tax=Streptomyces sp. NPDC102395 TaxID=3366168 RepID=UPI0037F8CE6C